MLHFRAKPLILKGVKKDSKKSGQAQAPSLILSSVNGEMKMRARDNRYGSKRDLAEFNAKTMRREQAHSREANFGSGRADELSKIMRAEQGFEHQAGMPGLSKMFGKLADEYAIYKACAPAPHKSFDEWLES